jgi:hypothetical protein
MLQINLPSYKVHKDVESSNGLGLVVNKDYFLSFFRMVTEIFKPLTTSGEIVNSVFKVICCFILLPYLLESSFYTYCYDSNKTLRLPGFIRVLIDKIGCPVRSIDLESTWGQVVVAENFTFLHNSLSSWDRDFFKELFSGSKYATVFTDSRKWSEFHVMWTRFLSLVNKFAISDDYDDFLVIVDYVFSDFSSSYYYPRNLYTSDSSNSKPFSKALGLYKFRNSPANFIYYIQAKGLSSTHEDTLSLYYAVFMLFNGQIVLDGNVDGGFNDLVPVGGNSPIPGDFRVDLSSLTFDEVCTCILSVRLNSTLDSSRNDPSPSHMSGLGKSLGKAQSPKDKTGIPSGESVRSFTTNLMSTSFKSYRFTVTHRLTPTLHYFVMY